MINKCRCHQESCGCRNNENRCMHRNNRCRNNDVDWFNDFTRTSNASSCVNRNWDFSSFDDEESFVERNNGCGCRRKASLECRCRCKRCR